MRKDIIEFIRSCSICQKVKYTAEKKFGLIQPLPIPDKPWTDITMDFNIGLPSSKGYVAILVVVDRFTKCAHFCALEPSFTASSVAEMFIQNVIKLYGFPRSIVLNRDPIFLSNFWSQLMHHSGTTLLHTTAYHPKSDGQSEVVN